MGARAGESRADITGGIVVGILGGAACGVLTDMVPPVGIAVLAVIYVRQLVLAVRNPASRLSNLATAAGLPIGWGGLFLILSINLIAACVGTDDSCGNANVVPLVAGSLAFLVVGLVIGATVWRSTRSR